MNPEKKTVYLIIFLVINIVLICENIHGIKAGSARYVDCILPAWIASL